LAALAEVAVELFDVIADQPEASTSSNHQLTTFFHRERTPKSISRKLLCFKDACESPHILTTHIFLMCSEQ
jgi:hypothetical protein